MSSPSSAIRLLLAIRGGDIDPPLLALSQPNVVLMLGALLTHSDNDQIYI